MAYSGGRLTGIWHPQKPSRPYNIHVHFDPPTPSAPQFMNIPTASVPPPLKKLPGYATVRGKSYRKPGTLRRRHGVRKRIAGVLAQSRQCDRRQSYHKVASLCSVSIVDDVAVYKTAARDRPTSVSQSRRRSLKTLRRIHRVNKSYYTQEQSCERDSNRAKTTSSASRRQSCTAGTQDRSHSKSKRRLAVKSLQASGSKKTGSIQLTETRKSFLRKLVCIELFPSGL